MPDVNIISQFFIVYNIWLKLDVANWQKKQLQVKQALD